MHIAYRHTLPERRADGGQYSFRLRMTILPHLILVLAGLGCAAPAVGASLTAFVIVYFLLFGMGTLYILRLMRHPPAALQQPVAAVEPIRTAGLMPGPAMGADGTAKGAVP